MGFEGFSRHALARTGRIAAALGLAITLAGCEEGAKFDLFKSKDTSHSDAVATETSPRTGKTVERDIEAPDVFQVTEAGLWDGRPSLGGVWVAHPDVKEPERVIIRNSANNKFVVGALFRRERDNPGPLLQVSSDAADALGMLAGQPAQLNVTALRREEVAEEPLVPQGESLAAPAGVEETSLDPIAGAAAAIDAADAANPPVAVADSKPKAPAKTSGLAKPYIQIGIFSIEKNANNTATAMRQAGMVPTVKKQKLKGKTFWRVLVGPANTSADQSALLKKIKSSGFTDAYAVTN